MIERFLKKSFQVSVERALPFTIFGCRVLVVFSGQNLAYFPFETICELVSANKEREFARAYHDPILTRYLIHATYPEWLPEELQPLLPIFLDLEGIPYFLSTIDPSSVEEKEAHTTLRLIRGHAIQMLAEGYGLTRGSRTFALDLLIEADIFEAIQSSPGLHKAQLDALDLGAGKGEHGGGVDRG